MSRAQSLFHKVNLSERQNYAVFVGKEVHLEIIPASPFQHIQDQWIRGLLVCAYPDKIKILVADNSIGVAEKATLEISPIRIRKLRLAGEDIYDDIFGR